MAEDAKEIASLETKIIPCLHNLRYYWKECIRQLSVQPFPCPEYRQDTVPPQDNHDREEKVAASAGQLPSTLPPLQDSIRAIAKRASKNTRRPLELSVPFVDPIEILVCDSRGKEFINSDHDITLRVPPGAIPDGVTVHIETGVTLHGPFQFPPGTRPISPIVWFCTQEGVPFLKPVEVILPHFLHNWDGLQLGFLKADHSTFTTDDGEKRYIFQPVNDPMELHLENVKGFGVLSTKHFCFLCIQANITHDQLPSKAQYCLTKVTPDPWPSMAISFPIHFCVTFLLPTCFETLKKQFPPGVRMVRKSFTFQTTELDHSEPKLLLEVYQSGWILAADKREIRAADVDFWGMSTCQLLLMEEEKIYPPRFTVQACGSSATGHSVARIEFKGSCEELVMEIVLSDVATPSREIPTLHGHSDLESSPVEREQPSQSPAIGTCYTPPVVPIETLHCPSRMEIPTHSSHSESTAMVPFLDEVDVLKCDSSGKEFTNTDHDITLRVPEGAIPDGVTVHIEAGVALHGPFQFPPGTRPISPIVWFCMQEDVPLLKPVEVILPHFLQHWKNLQLGFLKADHSTYTTDDGEKRYMFRPVNDPMEFHFENGRGFGVLSTKHFCSLCIHTSNITRDQLISEAQYCLTEVIPYSWPSMPIDVPLHFCVTFFLKTCFETLKKQFPPDVKIFRHKFTFQTTEPGTSEPKLQFEVHEPQFGWILARKCKEIRAADVDYWDEGGTKERPGLQLMEDEKMYPPRLTIEACGASATGSSVACLRFKGSCEDMYTEVLLPLRHQANVSTSPTPSVGGGGYAATPARWNCRNYHHLEGVKPSLPVLLRFPTERRNINIPQQIGSIHTDFGTFLLDDETGAIVDSIAQEHRGNADSINKEILKKWLQGRGRQPVTWRTLIEVLQDSQLTELANDIERNLSRLT